MFHRKITNTGYVFVLRKEQRYPLHMWFVFFPIDVLYLDSDKYIVEIKEYFKPFSLYFPKQKARYVIELPEGTISTKNLRIGDRIEF